MQYPDWCPINLRTGCYCLSLKITQNILYVFKLLIIALNFGEPIPDCCSK